MWAQIQCVDGQDRGRLFDRERREICAEESYDMFASVDLVADLRTGTAPRTAR